MDNFSEQIFDTLQFSVDHADCTEVSDWWAPYVSEFQFTRLYLITKGMAEITLLDRTIQLHEGNMYIIPPNSTISGQCDKYMNHYWLHLIADTFSENIIRYADIPLSITAPPYAESLFRIIANLYKDDSAYAHIMVRHALKILFAEFFRDGIKLNPEFLRFKDTIEYIDHNLHNEINIAQLAARMHLHPTYFSNLFTKVFKQPPQRYILQRRLNLAYKYLTTDMSINEIVESLHFYDAAYFSKLFKQHYAFSPSKFRAILKS